MINLGIDVDARISNSSINSPNQLTYNYVFITNSPAYAAKNKKSCAIINKVELFDSEYLLEIRFEDGSIAQALPEELYEMTNKHQSIYSSSDYLSEFKGNAKEEEDDDSDDFLDDEDSKEKEDPDEDPEYFDDDEFDDESGLDDDEDTFDTGSGYEDDDDDDL